MKVAHNDFSRQPFSPVPTLLALEFGENGTLVRRCIDVEEVEWYVRSQNMSRRGEKKTKAGPSGAQLVFKLKSKSKRLILLLRLAAGLLRSEDFSDINVFSFSRELLVCRRLICWLQMVLREEERKREKNKNLSLSLVRNLVWFV